MKKTGAQQQIKVVDDPSVRETFVCQCASANEIEGVYSLAFTSLRDTPGGIEARVSARLVMTEQALRQTRDMIDRLLKGDREMTVN